jgi:hypothetical protein
VIAVESTARINKAIHACLELCYQSSDPAHCIAEFLNRLRSDSEWTSGELAQVRSATIHILRKIATPEEDDGMPIGFLLEYRS